MTLLIGIVIGALASHWLESLLSRIVLKLPLPDGARATVRENARSQGIDLRERGKVIRLADVDAADALAKPGLLFDNLEKHEDS